VIRRVDLDHFKAFERFSLRLRGDAFVAGPNNAGKSTLIAAMRTAAKMLRHATRRTATYDVLDKGNRVVAHVFAPGQFGLIEENLRHEFRDIEARFTVRFENGVALTAVWPPTPEEQDAFFYLLDGDVSLRTPDDVARGVPSIGTIPILSPIDHQEGVLTSDRYIRDNIDGRLTSRHFRNQLMLLRREPDGSNYEAFQEFARPWIPELELGLVRQRFGPGGGFLDLFFREQGSRIEKEAFWAGDGLQIWFQILLHVFRLRQEDVLILDEPDVYLHPDLQRRLVHLLESVPAQTITATHSPEVLAEAPPESVIWVDKTRRTSVRAPDSSVLTELMTAMGTQFNIRLARALRANRVLFVEGDDMKMLRHLAVAVGAERVANETDIAVIPLRGYSNWDRIEPFVWLMRDLLHDAVDVYVILDRDYRTDDQVSAVQQQLGAIGAHVHVWRRKELENYLLEPHVLARALEMSEPEIRQRLDAITEPLLDFVTERASHERCLLVEKVDRPGVRTEVSEELESVWLDVHRRLAMCPPKEVLRRLNRSLEAEGRKAVTFQRLARTMRRSDVADEARNLLLRIDGSRES
jgi:hypothetical protein